MVKNELNELAHDIHAEALEKGFWDVDDAMVKHIAKMHSELSEALQEDRMNHPMLYVDDIDALDRITDPALFDGRKPEGIAAELADFVMMALDMMVLMGINVGKIGEDFAYTLTSYYEPKGIGIKLPRLIHILHGGLSSATIHIPYVDWNCLLNLVSIIDIWLIQHDVDLWQVVRLKLDYNKSRPALHGRKY